MIPDEYNEIRYIKPTYSDGDWVNVVLLSGDRNRRSEERGLELGQRVQIRRVWQLSTGPWAVDLEDDTTARWAFHFGRKMTNEERMKIRQEELCVQNLRK